MQGVQDALLRSLLAIDRDNEADREDVNAVLRLAAALEMDVLDIMLACSALTVNADVYQ